MAAGLLGDEDVGEAEVGVCGSGGGEAFDHDGYVREGGEDEGSDVGALQVFQVHVHWRVGGRRRRLFGRCRRRVEEGG